MARPVEQLESDVSAVLMQAVILRDALERIAVDPTQALRLRNVAREALGRAARIGKRTGEA